MVCTCIHRHKSGKQASLTDAKNVDLVPEMLRKCFHKGTVQLRVVVVRGTKLLIRSTRDSGSTTIKTIGMMIALLVDLTVINDWNSCHMGKCYDRVLRYIHVYTVHCKLNYNYYPHKARKRSRRASGIFFVFLIHFLRIFRWFRHLTKISVTSVTFRRF